MPEFLVPLFAVAGGLAAAIPIALHMLRRAPTQQMSFSLVKFLRPSQPKLTKRSSIEHWPLMLLRILALVLIGLAFARPFLREVIPLLTGDDEFQAVTILIDTSASMRREGIREQVGNAVREAVDSLKPVDRLTVATFDDQVATQISSDQWAAAESGERAALIDSLLEELEPTWRATRTGLALQLSAETLAAESAASSELTERRLVLITDFQRGSSLDELQSGSWPAGVKVQLVTVAPEAAGNVGLTSLQDESSNRVSIRLTSAGDSSRTDFELQPFDASGAPVGEPISAKVAPGQRTAMLLPATEGTAAVAGVELLGDEHPFDNVIDLPEVDNASVNVAHIGPAKLNDPESMRYYLQRVLSGNVERDVQLVDLIPDDKVVLPIPADVQFCVATTAVPGGLLKSVEELLARDGTLLLAATAADDVQSIQTLLPVKVVATEAEVDDYAMLGSVDFDHPVFSAFSEARFADFSAIQFAKHRSASWDIDSAGDNVSVLAKFDSGSPALVEFRPENGGRILLLLSGWHPTDSQLALSTRFPALLTRMLTLASPAQQSQLQLTVGETVRPAEIVGTENWTMVGPENQPITPEDEGIQLTEPGRYSIRTEGDEQSEPQRVTLIATLSVAESRTEMLPIGQLQVLGIGVEQASTPEEGEADAGASNQLTSRELEDRQKWWRVLLLAGLGCLAIEALWAKSLEAKVVA